MKVLVTGGAGFIGSHIVDLLVDEGHDVFVIDDFSTGREENKNERAQYHVLDIKEDAARQLVAQEKPDSIFHFAAQISVRSSVEDPFGDAATNILGSLNIVEGARRAGNAPKIVFASTGGAIYGETDELPTTENCEPQPVSPYGLAKYVVERYLEHYERLHGIPFVALRFANVYGPRQNVEGEAGVVAAFAQQMLSGIQPTISGDGTQTRDFVYVKDAARAALLAPEHTEQNAINIGTGVETSINQLFEIMNEQVGSAFRKEYSEARKGDIARSALSREKAREELGWEPEVEISEGVEKTIQWFSSNK